MLAEQPVSPSEPVSPSLNQPIEPLRDKIRLRFAKLGDLRFLSHHDLLRTFDRMLRRSALPVRQTQGFNPKARLIFALSLPLGVVGCQEVAELEFTELLPIEEITGRLSSQCPPGLQLLSVQRIAPKASAQVRSFCYRLQVPLDRVEAARLRLTEVLAQTECWAERTKPEPRRLDIRPFLRDLRIVEAMNQGVDSPPTNTQEPTPRLFLEMDLWLTPTGTARPDEILGLLGLADLLEAGFVLERSRLELHDELPPL